MLSCKEFVASQGEILEGKEYSLGKRISLKMHYFMCHHCRRYFKQIRLVDAVAKKLSPEKVHDDKVAELMANMPPQSESKDS